MGILPAFKRSFFCSPEREDGMKLQLMYEDGFVYTDMYIDRRFEGYKEVVHGGMLFGILDTIMWHVILMETKMITMTRKTEMEFFRPVMCNTPYRAKGKLERIAEKDVYASAWIEDRNGEYCAKVTALFREVKDIPIADWVKGLDYSRTTPEIKAHFLSLLEK